MNSTLRSMLRAGGLSDAHIDLIEAGKAPLPIEALDPEYHHRQYSIDVASQGPKFNSQGWNNE